MYNVTLIKLRSGSIKWTHRSDSYHRCSLYWCRLLLFCFWVVVDPDVRLVLGRFACLCTLKTACQLQTGNCNLCLTHTVSQQQGTQQQKSTHLIPFLFSHGLTTPDYKIQKDVLFSASVNYPEVRKAAGSQHDKGKHRQPSLKLPNFQTNNV